MDAACGVMFCNCLEADFVFYVLSDLYLKYFQVRGQMLARRRAIRLFCDRF